MEDGLIRGKSLQHRLILKMGKRSHQRAKFLEKDLNRNQTEPNLKHDVHINLDGVILSLENGAIRGPSFDHDFCHVNEVTIEQNFKHL